MMSHLVCAFLLACRKRLHTDITTGSTAQPNTAAHCVDWTQHPKISENITLILSFQGRLISILITRIMNLCIR